MLTDFLALLDVSDICGNSLNLNMHPLNILSFVYLEQKYLYTRYGLQRDSFSVPSKSQVHILGYDLHSYLVLLVPNVYTQQQHYSPK